MQDLYETLDTLIEIFDRRGTNYTIIGGIAVRAHAIPRNTVDLDLMVSIDSSELPHFFDELTEAGFEVPESFARGWTDRVRNMPLVKVRFYLGGNGIDADLFLADSSFQKSVIQRRVAVDVEGRQYWIATAEDLVLLKLLADRPRDRLDVADLFFISGQLDMTYLGKWADQLKVRSQLEVAIREAGEQ